MGNDDYIINNHLSGIKLFQTMMKKVFYPTTGPQRQLPSHENLI